MKLVGESLEDFKKKYGFKDGDTECINCGKKAIYNEYWYEEGWAMVQFKHDCAPQYWVTSMVSTGTGEPCRNTFSGLMQDDEFAELFGLNYD